MEKWRFFSRLPVVVGVSLFVVRLRLTNKNWPMDYWMWCTTPYERQFRRQRHCPSTRIILEHTSQSFRYNMLKPAVFIFFYYVWQISWATRLVEPRAMLKSSTQSTCCSHINANKNTTKKRRLIEMGTNCYNTHARSPLHRLDSVYIKRTFVRHCIAILRSNSIALRFLCIHFAWIYLLIDITDFDELQKFHN